MADLKLFEAAIDELEEAPDRSAAIVGAAFLEDALSFAICQGIGIDREDPRANRLFRPGGPLNSYSARVTMGHAMDLFGDRTKRELECIASIRNRFAHKLDERSFESQEIREKCKLLNRQGQMAQSRALFENAVKTLTFLLEFDAVAGGKRNPDLD